MIYGEDVASSSSTRWAARAAHLARVQELIDGGRLVLAGALPNLDSPDPGPAGMAGSLIVAEFDSLEAARHWVADDPYVTQRVFGRVAVRPFQPLIPA